MLQHTDDFQTTGRYRGAVDFAVEGDLRFLSHQETLRMFARACARARLPVRQSEGFNPRPRISLPLPRPVGIASDAERMLVEFSELIETETITDRLSEQVPAGICIHSARLLHERDRCQPKFVRYRVDATGIDADLLKCNAARMLRPEPLPYRRFVHKNSRHSQIDLRPFIEAIDVSDGFVDLTLLVTAGGSAKPAEICDELGIGARHVNHLIQRLEILWHDSP